MSANGSLFPYPRGKAPEQLYETLRVLSNRLNQAQTGDATDLTGLQSAIAAAKSDIVGLQAQIDAGVGITPQQLYELSLVTAVDDMLGSVSSLVKDTIERSHKASEAAIKAMLAGLENKGAINVEQVVRKGESEVFVSQLSTFEANLAGTQASVADEIVARTNGDSAIASDISTLTTTVNGNTAQISIIATSIDGLEGRFGIAVNLQGQVVGLVQLDGTAAGSNFTVVANKFLIAQPGETGGAPVPVFQIANVGGVAKLAFRGDMYADGSITVQKLNVNRLSAISADMGEVTVFRLRSPNGNLDINSAGADGKPYIRLSNA